MARSTWSSFSCAVRKVGEKCTFFFAGAFVAAAAVDFTGTTAFFAGATGFFAGAADVFTGAADFFTGTTGFFAGAADFFAGAADFFDVTCLAGAAALTADPFAGAFTVDFATAPALPVDFFTGADFLADAAFFAGEERVREVARDAGAADFDTVFFAAADLLAPPADFVAAVLAFAIWLRASIQAQKGAGL